MRKAYVCLISLVSWLFPSIEQYRQKIEVECKQDDYRRKNPGAYHATRINGSGRNKIIP